MWQPVSHTTHGPWQSSCHTRLTTVELVIDFSIFDLGGLPLSKVHQKGRWPTTRLDLPSYKISARSRKRSTRYALPKFFTFWLMGANPLAKVHQKGGWPASHPALPSCKVSSPYVNPRPGYPLPKFLRTEKQTNRKTVTDISPHADRHVGIMSQENQQNADQVWVSSMELVWMQRRLVMWTCSNCWLWT